MTHRVLLGLVALVVIAATGWTCAGLRNDTDRRRAAWLAGLRCVSVILLVLVLIQPQFRRSEWVVDRPLVGVLIDNSQSMNDGPAPDTRASVAREWLDSATFRKARETCDLRFFSIARNLTDTVPGELEFNGTESRINAALTDWSRRWSREGAAGVVLISDGLDTGGKSPVSLDLPCWVMEVEPPGTNSTERVAIWQVDPPRRPVAGAENSVRVVLQGWGVEGRDIPVELWSDGHKLGEKHVRFNRRGDVVETMLPLKPEKPGSYAYEIRVADSAADASAKSQPFTIAVRQEGRSVLLLSNTLGFEGKFLRRALTTDRNVRLDSYTRWQDGRWANIDGEKSTLDLSPAALSSRSAIVISDVSPEALNAAQWQAISDFADKGGGLVVLGGPNLLGSPQAAACLGRVLPVPTPAPHRDGHFGVKLTDAGLRHPVFGPLFEAVKDFPTLEGANLTTGVAGNAQVLMETVADGQARPLVVVKQQGSGRVAVVLSDTLWRWRVASPGGWNGNLSAYDTFWSQMLDWLSPDQEGLQSRGRIELTADRPFYQQGDKVVIRAEWIGKGAAPFEKMDLTVQAPSGKPRLLALQKAIWKTPEGRQVTGFSGESETEGTGVYEVEAHATWDGGEVRDDRNAR